MARGVSYSRSAPGLRQFIKTTRCTCCWAVAPAAPLGAGRSWPGVCSLVCPGSRAGLPARSPHFSSLVGPRRVLVRTGVRTRGSLHESCLWKSGPLWGWPLDPLNLVSCVLALRRLKQRGRGGTGHVAATRACPGAAVSLNAGVCMEHSELGFEPRPFCVCSVYHVCK